MSKRNVQKAAEHYITKMNWTLIPCRAASADDTGKEPRSRVKGWGETTDPNAFSADANIGVVLGQKSNGLKDIDLDCPEARVIAEYVLPKTSLISGREYGGVKMASHFYYRTEKEAGTTKFVGSAGTMLELRGDGGYTILPPSVVRKGDDISEVEWIESGEPTFIAQEDLLSRCKLIAVGVDFAQQVQKGAFHDAMLALAGGLAHANVELNIAEALFTGICKASGQKDVADRIKSLRDTYKNHAEGKNVKGLPSLEECSIKMHRMAGWLGSKTVVESVSWELPQRVTLDEIKNFSITRRVLVEDYLYADIGVLGAVGGTGKSTLKLQEAVLYVLGWNVWGNCVASDGNVLFITAEDDHKVMWRTIFEITKELGLSTEECERVLDKIRISDLTDLPHKLVMNSPKYGIENSPLVEEIASKCQGQNFDIIVIDPMVSFGVGEAQVNDAEQALISAARAISRRLDCYVGYVHHLSKVSTKTKDFTLLAFRGGSSLADGSRIAQVMHSYRYGEISENEREENLWRTMTGLELAEGEVGIALAMPKNKYTHHTPRLFFTRGNGYTFKQVFVSRKSPEQRAEDKAMIARANAENDLELLLGFMHRKDYVPESMRTLRTNREFVPIETQARFDTAFEMAESRELICNQYPRKKGGQPVAGYGLTLKGLRLLEPYLTEEDLKAVLVGRGFADSIVIPAESRANLAERRV